MFVLSGKLYTVAEGFLSLSIQQVNACRTAGGGWMKRTLPCCTSTWNSRRACPYSSSRSADAHQAFSSLALRQDSKRDEISWDVGPPPASQSWIAIYKSQKNKKNKIKIAVYVYVILFFTRNLLLLWCIGIMVYVSPEMGTRGLARIMQVSNLNLQL